MLWRRRDFVRGLNLLTLYALGSCGKPLPPIPATPIVGDTATGIDVHCHVFNARDLPIVGFVTDVVMEGVPIAPELLKPFIVLVALIMDTCAWPADKEARAIAQGETLSAFTATRPGTKLETRAALTAAVTQFRQKSGRYHEFSKLADEYLQDNGRRVPEAAGVDRDSQLLQFLISRGDANAARNPNILANPQAAADAAARGAVSIEDDISGVCELAFLLTLRRLELVQRLANLPASQADADSIALYCPAMVDYSYWLKEGVTPLQGQITVMSAISTLKGRSFGVHPWVSFCPWRQLMEPDQLSLIQDAVQTKGFIGVKLYPVMGFRPYGNTGASDAAQYPPRLRRLAHWDSRLDAALAQLYDWCIREDVPIMAHCSHSQFPTDAAGLRGAPKEWRKVFEQPAWRNLRVNLGHIGGIWDLAKPSNNGWVSDVVDIVRTYPNVYADLADDADAVELNCADQCPGKTEAAILGTYLDRGPAPGMTYDPRKKLMYGTDWVMLSRDPGTDQYLSGLRQNIAGALHIDAQDFLGMNAARFLGLDQPVSIPKGAASRLDALYRANGLPVDYLKRWRA